MESVEKSPIDPFVACVERELLPGLRVESVHPDEPVVVQRHPAPWEVLGRGNYAAVMLHPDWPDRVVKVYAPGRPGLEDEAEVYRRLGEDPSYSRMLHAGPGYLVLARLVGTTLFDALHKGMRIEPSVIEDIDRALERARERGLHPHDVHAKNLMIGEDGRGLVVDVSDFGHTAPCTHWDDLKRAYRAIYQPVLLRWPVPLPFALLEAGRWGYRQWKRRRGGEC